MMRNEYQDIKESVHLLCTKYRTLLRTIPAWSIDTLLGVAYENLHRQDTNRDIQRGVAEDYSNEANERKLRILLEELRVLHEKMNEMGMTMDDALRMISPERMVSRLTIDEKGLLYFNDYQKTIRLTPIQTAIYIMVIRHEEGFAVKDLVDHKEELSDILESVLRARKQNMSHQRQDALLKRLFDITSGAINENVSRIKRTMINELGDETMARNYYINSLRLHKLRIPIDRRLVFMML